MRTGKIIAGMTAAVLIGTFVFSGCGGGEKPSGAAANTDTVISETCRALIENTPSPAFSSIGGDWLIKGLVCAEAEVPDDYYDIYYDSVRAAVKSSGGVLSEDHYTEYMRAVIGLTSIGKDPYDVEGYDLTPYLDEYEPVAGQGANAEGYAIIAAGACGYELKNEDAYLADIFAEMADEKMKEDKGYPDYLSISLEACSLCPDNDDAQAFLKDGIDELSGLQNEDGSFGSSAESTAECIIALTQAGIDLREDERFIKNGNSALDGLMMYYEGNGIFKHQTDDEEGNSMAAEKALLALDAVKLSDSGRTLYE